jgi:hypothetical protein
MDVGERDSQFMWAGVKVGVKLVRKPLDWEVPTSLKRGGLYMLMGMGVARIAFLDEENMEL